MRHGIAGALLGVGSLAVASLALPLPAVGQIMDAEIYTLVMFDQLEYRRTGQTNPVSWDLSAWVGGDFTRLWIKSEGSHATIGGEGAVEVQALYSRLVAPFWEVQLGAQLDARYGTGGDRIRVQAAVGLEGLAPYWFEVEPVLFVSQDGHVSGRLTASYDMRITQRLVAQPRIEARAAVQRVPDFGVGSGLNDVTPGLRLRYELQREYAPYLGISWHRRFGNTADLALRNGAGTSDLALIGGLRVWF